MTKKKAAEKASDIAAELVGNFKTYLERELKKMDPTPGRKIPKAHIEKLEGRIRKHVDDKNPAPSLKMKGDCNISRNRIEKFTLDGKAYLKGVAGVLGRKSRNCSAAKGSASEEIGKLLKKLATEFSRQARA